MISDNYPKAERDDTFHDDSYFEVTFEDGSVRNERDLNWSAISELKEVDYQNGKRSVYLAIPKITHIKIVHLTVTTEFDIPDDCVVYQSIKSNATFVPGGASSRSTVGRFVGLVKDGRIIEERFLNANENTVLGFKE